MQLHCSHRASLAVWLLALVANLTGINRVGMADGGLEQAFRQPPDSARPWVYWFWLNGNLTREGITADLEAMKRAGVGGVLIMEVDQGAPVGPVDFMGAAWRELFKHMVAEAARLGLEVNMNNDAGWNGSGGPWITPEQSMQKVVFTEINVEGPRHLEEALPVPETVAGFYRDITVQAFPAVGTYRIADARRKAGYETASPPLPSTQQAPAGMAIEPARLADLTAKMDKDGRLVWEVPEGRWTILRIGHTSTGVVNAPAPATGRGLECDKLSKAGIEAQFTAMMAKLIEDVGPAAGKTLAATHIDSWENGAQNWTSRMREEFKRRRGYDMWAYLPVFTGRVVGTLEVSERFGWDLRQTISELIVENYAGHLRALAGRHGVRLSIEAYGAPTDDLPYGGQADEPMSEFWIGNFMYENSKEMASVAHTYGKPILGAETFTATDAERWREHPASFKSLGDQAFCAGVNRFVFHRYAMQPWLDRKPGMTMGPWGLHYERTNTWWDQTPAWHAYLARCQHLLRQGRFVADLCYLQPENAPQGFHGHPRGNYDFDNCSAEVVLTRMSVRDGRLVLPDGMSYALLVLPQVPSMTPALLGKLKELVSAGATVVGAPPVRSPSLTGYPACDEQVRALAAEIWGDADGERITEHRLGAGRVIRGIDPEQVLANMKVMPDFAGPSGVNYIHRQTQDEDIYFVANAEAVAVNASCSFRVKGMRPEFWWPDTASIEPAAMYKPTEHGVDVLIPLGPAGSVFVVFRQADKAKDAIVQVMRGQEVVLSAARVAPKIIIERAVYGVLEDAQRTRDAREAVQQMVDRSGGSFVVAQVVSMLGDPAPGVVKTLDVAYRLGDHRGHVRGADSETLHFGEDGHRIVVTRARYGVLNDPARTRDMREKLQRMVDAGVRSFPVSRMAQGDDPAYMVVKTLEMEYTLDGRPNRFSGRDPELVRLVLPESAWQIVGLHRADDGQTRLEAWEPGRYTVQRAGGKHAEVDASALAAAVALSGAWNVAFTPGWGAPASIRLDALISWSEHAEPGVKYYSGAAVYRQTFVLPADLLAKDRKLMLDLGRVEIMAQVSLNGRDLGLLWKPPYRVEATGALRSGENRLEVRVISQWPNRMIGDEQLPEDSERNPDGTLKLWPTWLGEGKPSPTGRFTFTSWRLWKKDDALLPSGLLGPVTLRPVADLTVE